MFAGDGDLMEGVSSEAASLAGALGLDRLTVFYDDNHISIEGSTDLAFCEQVGERFDAYGWHVHRVDDVNDLDALDDAVEAARAEAHPELAAELDRRMASLLPDGWQEHLPTFDVHAADAATRWRHRSRPTRADAFCR